jgi:hypothetical protein
VKAAKDSRGFYYDSLEDLERSLAQTRSMLQHYEDLNPAKLSLEARDQRQANIHEAKIIIADQISLRRHFR